ncbi:VanZ family protein [Candidatus Saccharibacteria bacterium]|nr:VanZ family protein [Candidatus Saccharibacteria bacterium]
MTKKVKAGLVAKVGFVLLWMALIFWLSGHDATESSKQSGAVLRTLHESGATWLTMHEVRKIAHFLLYMVLGMSLLNLLRALLKRRHVTYAILGAALYAISDEIHQLFITGRSSELRDVLLDTIGASVGVSIYLLVVRKRGAASEAPTS